MTDLPTRHENPTNPADLPTRHENPTNPADLPTRHENAAVRPGPAGGTWFGQLPQGVVAQYDFIRPLSTAGAQADVLLFRDRSNGQEVVIKLFRGHPQINLDTYDKLRTISAEHVAPILDLRIEEDGVWEVQEYLRHGSLLDLLRERGGGPQPIAFVRQVLTELTPALRAIHAHDITHRDLKPGNILVRSAEPFDLVLGDFGFARDITMSAEYMSVVGVFHYTAPEAISGEAGPAIDWWSLGVIIYELLTGNSLFLNDAGQREPDQRIVQKHLHRHTYSVDAVIDPRWNLLLRGLLNRSRVHRWNETQVEAWLSGKSPQVVQIDEAIDEGPPPLAPLSVPGGQFTDPEKLIVALATRWDDACTYLTGQGATYLSHWLQDTPTGARTTRLLGSVRATDISPQEALVLLQVILAPGRTPLFRDRAIDGRTLTAAAKGAVRGDAKDRVWIHDVRRYQVLAALGTHPTQGAAMADADIRLRQMWTEMDDLLRTARKQPATHYLVNQISDGALEGVLLAAALDPNQRESLLQRGTRVALGIKDRDGQLHRWSALLQRGSVPAALLLDLVATQVLKQREDQERAEQARLAEAERQRLHAEAEAEAARIRQVARDAAATRRALRDQAVYRLWSRMKWSLAWPVLLFVFFANLLPWGQFFVAICLPPLAAIAIAAVLEFIIRARPPAIAYAGGLVALILCMVTTVPYTLAGTVPLRVLASALFWWAVPLPLFFTLGYAIGFLGWAWVRGHLPGRNPQP